MRGSTQRRCDRALGSPPGRARIGSTACCSHLGVDAKVILTPPGILCVVNH
jgi:hypothetical protein